MDEIEARLRSVLLDWRYANVGMKQPVGSGVSYTVFHDGKNYRVRLTARLTRGDVFEDGVLTGDEDLSAAIRTMGNNLLMRIAQTSVEEQTGEWFYPKFGQYPGWDLEQDVALYINEATEDWPDWKDYEINPINGRGREKSAR